MDNASELVKQRIKRRNIRTNFSMRGKCIKIHQIKRISQFKEHSSNKRKIRNFVKVNVFKQRPRQRSVFGKEM